MKKKLFALLVCTLLCTAALCMPAAAQGETATVVINGTQLEDSDAPVKLVQGRTMIPFRPVFLALGIAVPLLVCRSVARHTIVERLREADA